MTEQASPTAEEAQAYIALGEKATPGPLKTEDWEQCWAIYVADYVADERGSCALAEVYTEADARFFAASRTAGPRLAHAWLAEHERAEGAQASERDARFFLRHERHANDAFRSELAEAKIIHEETLGKHHLDNERLTRDVKNWRDQVRMSEETVSQGLEKLAEARAEVERLQTILRRCTDVGCRWAGSETAGLDKQEETSE